MDDIAIFKRSTIAVVIQNLDALYRTLRETYMRKRLPKSRFGADLLKNIENMGEWPSKRIDDLIINMIRKRNTFLKERYRLFAESVAKRNPDYKRFDGSFKVADLETFIAAFLSNLSGEPLIQNGRFFKMEQEERSSVLSKIMDDVMRINIMFVPPGMATPSVISPGWGGAPRGGSQAREMSKREIEAEEEKPAVPSRMRFKVDDKAMAVPDSFASSFRPRPPSPPTVTTVEEESDDDEEAVFDEEDDE